MNTAAYDVWRTSDPNDDSIREAAQERDQDLYLQNWIDGHLVELGGEDLYHGPVQRALEADGISDIAAAIEAKQAGDWKKVTLHLVEFLTDVEEEIRKDAARK